MEIEDSDPLHALLAVLQHFLVGADVSKGDKDLFDSESTNLHDKGAGAAGLEWTMSFLCKQWKVAGDARPQGVTVTNEDILSSYSLVLSLARKLPSKEEGQKLVESFVDPVKAAAGSSLDGKTAVAVLGGLFNALEATSASRGKVLLAIFEAAPGTGAYVRLAKHLADLPAWLEGWGTGAADAAAMYAAAAALAKSEGDADTAYRCTLRQLAAYQGGAAGSAASVQAVALEACLAAVADPLVKFNIVTRGGGMVPVREEISLVSLDAVQALTKAGGDNAKIVELLQIFVEGKLEGLAAFQKADAGVLGRLGVDEEAAKKSLRLLSLCSLCAESEELPYAKVAEALDVPTDDVELWIVEVRGTGLEGVNKIGARREREREREHVFWFG